MRRTREGVFVDGLRSSGGKSAQFISIMWLFVTAGMLLVGLHLHPAHAAEKYSIKDIGAVGAGGTVEGLNERGEIVGAVPVSPGGTRFNGWWYKDGEMTDMNKCGGIGCRAMDINRAGQIVGNIGRAAYIHTHGKFIDIAAFVRPPGIALALNDLAEIVGWYTLIPVPGENYAPEKHAFLYRGRKFTDLGTLGGVDSVATDINDQSQVVGYSSTYGGETHAFLYHNGRMVDLGTLGGTESRATSINQKSHIVGSANLAGSNKQHAFLYADGKMTDLGTLDGSESVASCINNAGLIVGMSGLRGFLYSQGKMIDLLTLAPQESKWKMLTPRCINDRGLIAGTGVMADGLPHIFLMSPNP
ncbi:MAG: DUF3466 family protein [Nitrospira sp.]|nr:DUF3466 family protein [Nitrospira sp.]